jgi:hypothetical protein
MRLASEITRSPTFPPSVGMTRFFSNLLVPMGGAQVFPARLHAHFSLCFIHEA